MSRVVLCDTPEQVTWASAHADDAVVVATTPTAWWQCDKEHVEYVDLDAAVDPAAMNELAEETMVLQYKWAAELDRRLVADVEAFNGANFHPARAYLYWLKRTMDNLIIPARVLHEFCRHARVESVLVFERQPFNPGFGPLAPARPLFALIARSVLPDSVEVLLRADPTPGEAASIARRRILRARAGAFRRRVLRMLRSRGGSRGPVLVWAGNDYDLQLAVPHLRRLGAKIVGVPALAGPQVDVAQHLEELWSTLRGEDATWAPLDNVSAGLRPVFAPFLEKWVTREVPIAYSRFTAARKWLQDIDPAAIFSTEVQDTTTAAILSAAGALGMPRVLAIHNPPGGAADLPVQDALGPIQGDVYLVNGEGDVEYFDELGARFGTFPRGRLVSVGSARMDAMRSRPASRRSPSRRPVVLYVPTNLPGCYRYFCEGYTSDLAYVRLQLRMLKLLSASADVRVVYKPFPVGYAHNPVESDMGKLFPSVEVSFEPLTRLLFSADAVIIDFPSTALAEAVMTDAPLVVYADRNWGRMTASGGAALRKRATLSETPEQFESDVADLLRGLPRRAASDSTFRRLYVTHDDDGRSAERAAHAILDVARARVGA